MSIEMASNGYAKVAQALELEDGAMIYSNEETPPVESSDRTSSCPITVSMHNLDKARRLLYLSHVVAQFSEQAWDFSLILFLAAFSNYKSLILVSSYGFVNHLLLCLFGAAAGNYVDRTDRLRVAKWCICSENVCVILGTALCYVLLLRVSVHDEVDDDSTESGQVSSGWFSGVPTDTSSIALLIGIHIFGPLAKILDNAFSVAVEREWVVVMSLEASTASSLTTQTTWLSETNICMRQIDLSCRVVAPAVAGFVVAAFGGNEPHHDLTGAVVLVGAVNGCSLIVEYICTLQIFQLVPSLGAQKEPPKDRDEEDDDDYIKPFKATCDGAFGGLPYGLRVYFSQPISCAGLGLALLYVNALTFGGLMTAYLVWRGMRFETIGIWRGISSALGLTGTVVFRISSQRMTLVDTGMWSIIFEFVCLSLCFASFFVDNYNASMTMLIAAVCASRIGLWVFDISITQLMQEFIPDGIRGVVGGTQHSLNAFFSMSGFTLALILPNPRHFYIVCLAGYAAIAVAMILYAVGVYGKKERYLTPSDIRV